MTGRFSYYIQIGNKDYRKPSFDDEKTIYMAQHIIYPESEYGTRAEFYHEALEEAGIIPEGHFVAVMNLTTTNPYFPQEPDALMKAADEPDYIEGSLNALDFFRTEKPPEDVTSRAIDNLLNDEIEVKEMLASLRIDVLVPGASTMEQEVLRGIREELEEKFEVTDVFDWRKKSPKEMAEFIASCDNLTDNGVKEWEERTKTLVQTAENWHQAS